jgi:hypothetical protein
MNENKEIYKNQKDQIFYSKNNINIKDIINKEIALEFNIELREKIVHAESYFNMFNIKTFPYYEIYNNKKKININSFFIIDTLRQKNKELIKRMENPVTGIVDEKKLIHISFKIMELIIFIFYYVYNYRNTNIKELINLLPYELNSTELETLMNLYYENINIINDILKEYYPTINNKPIHLT